MSDNFKRRVTREQMRTAVLAGARAHGCTCNPEIEIPRDAGPGLVRMVTVRHDDDCPHRRDPEENASIGERINRGEFDDTGNGR